MAISITWATKVIYVPKADLTLISGTLYELDTDTFRLVLKDLEDDEDGIAFERTHDHVAQYTVAGITYARKVEILNGYSVEFEDGQYTVRLTGSNNNIFDVGNGILVQNQVQVIPNNSAGLVDIELISNRILELWQEKGLDIDNPLTVSATNRSFGSVSQTISGTDTVTVQRD